MFIYYTTTTDNRIAKLELGGQPKPILTGIPISGIHNGGRLHFGPDGFLYASTGDASKPGTAPRTCASLGGKILRMTTDGKPAPGNPFPNSLVWTYGHRNVQGFAWDAAKRMYATEFGQNTWDEINRDRAGQELRLADGRGQGRTTTGSSTRSSSGRPTEASCSGAAMVGQRARSPPACAAQRLWLMQLDRQGGTLLGRADALPASTTYGRLRAAVVAPDGSHLGHHLQPATAAATRSRGRQDPADRGLGRRRGRQG